MAQIIQYELAHEAWRFTISPQQVISINPTNIVAIGWWSNDPSRFPHIENPFIVAMDSETLKFLWLTTDETGIDFIYKLLTPSELFRANRQPEQFSNLGRIYRMDAGNGPSLLFDYPLIHEVLKGRVEAHISSPNAANIDRAEWVKDKCPIPVELIRNPDMACGNLYSTELMIPKHFHSLSGHEFGIKFVHRISELEAFAAGERTESSRNDYVTRAALFTTLDGGESWHELPWSLDVSNSIWPPHKFLANLFSWTPGMITGIRVENGRLAVYFEDDVPEVVPELKIVLNPQTQKWTISRLERSKWLWSS